MKILFFGDIVGRTGREAIKKILPSLKEKFEPDFVLANVENIAHGKGVTESTVKEVSEFGIDFFTTGNHVWNNTDGKLLLDKNNFPIIRPANYPVGVPGKGYKIIIVKTKRLLIVNLIGRVFMRENFDDPFKVLNEILDSEEGNYDYVFVDFHCESTSEKKAFAFYFDGKVSAVLGTHTHVPTADEQILPLGTAFISDVGMVGSFISVLGVKKEDSIKRFLTQLPYRLECEESPAEVGAVFVEFEKNSLIAKNIARIREIVV